MLGVSKNLVIEDMISIGFLILDYTYLPTRYRSDVLDQARDNFLQNVFH